MFADAFNLFLIYSKIEPERTVDFCGEAALRACVSVATSKRANQAKEKTEKETEGAGGGTTASFLQIVREKYRRGRHVFLISVCFVSILSPAFCHMMRTCYCPRSEISVRHQPDFTVFLLPFSPRRQLQRGLYGPPGEAGRVVRFVTFFVAVFVFLESAAVGVGASLWLLLASRQPGEVKTGSGVMSPPCRVC